MNQNYRLAEVFTNEIPAKDGKDGIKWVQFILVDYDAKDVIKMSAMDHGKAMEEMEGYKDLVGKMVSVTVGMKNANGKAMARVVDMSEV